MALLMAIATPLHADFAFAVSPPRFELSGRPGERIRQVIEITNSAPRASALLVRTADWELRPDESVLFHDELQTGSCRPWVAIERREVLVGARQSYRFRFEVTPPPGVAPTECRFAILLEGKEPSFAGATRSLPIAARMGLIVYVGVGDVRPQLSVVGSGVQLRNGQPVPMIQVHNGGTAHGRLDGFLNGRDARGRSFEVTPAQSPVLAGETRWVALNLTRPGDTEASPAYPLTIEGKLEWGRGQGTPLQLRLEQ